DGVKSSASKFIDETAVAKLREKTQAEKGDAILLFADATDAALAAAGKMRNEIGERAGLRDPKQFTFAWVTDFPLFERNEETGEPFPAHHPFTAPLDGQWP